MDCPRKVERRVGTLTSFNTKPGESHAYVRVKDTLLHVPISARGVLQDDGQTIVLCANGDRYNPLKLGSAIAIDLVFDADGKNPAPGLWAPKQKPQP